MIIFYQDKAQLHKIVNNCNLNANTIAILYKSVYPLKINILSGNSFSYPPNAFFLIIRIFFASDQILSEYANFLPRFVSCFFRKRLISTVFGVLNIDSMRLIGTPPMKLLSSQVADEYWLFGRMNRTKKIIPHLEKIASVKVFERSDLPDFRLHFKTDFVLFIGQSWIEEGLEFYDQEENAALKLLEESKYGLIVCKHPRSAKKYARYNCVNGYFDLIKWIEKNGRPFHTFYLSSSLGDELREMGLDATRLLSETHLTIYHSVNLDIIKKIVN